MRLAPALLPALLLLAGCAGPPAAPAPEPAAAEAPAPVPLVWDLIDCEAIAWEVPVPASRLASRLPDGFAPTPAASGAPAPPGVEQVSLLGFEAVECASGFGSPAMAARSVPYARLYTPVVPPSEDADRRPGAQHAFVWAAVVADDEWRQRLAAAGLPVHDGGTLVGPVAQGHSAQLALEGEGVFSMTGRADAAERPLADQPLRDFTPAGEGLAAWVGTRESVRSASGVGVWEAPPGSWVADLLGASSGVAPFRLEHYSIPHEAVIRPGDAGGEPIGGPRDG